jgi:hypothetical protein
VYIEGGRDLQYTLQFHRYSIIQKSMGGVIMAMFGLCVSTSVISALIGIGIAEAVIRTYDKLYKE